MNLKLLAKRLTTALLLLAMPFIVSAQQKTVNGKITSDKDGSPISGATVLAKGSTKGTQTAADGSYILEVPAATKKLIVSSVGFGTQELNIGADNTASLVLKASNDALTEVVVIGYGTARKKDLTGAVGSVSAKNFNKGPTTSPDLLIQGKVTGVQVLTNSGAPGAGTTIRVRGAASLRAGNTPLFVVDGVPLSNTNARPDLSLAGDVGGSTPSGNPLNFLNAADIAEMVVLKDASAAAIYGSRAANGVVLITTKRGQSGTPKIDFSASFGTSKIAKKLKVLSGDEYRSALTQFGAVGGNFGANTDALGSILRNGSAQNYNISLGSGTENSRYRISLGYLDQKGIIRKTDFKRYSATLASSFKMLESKKLNLDVNLTTSQSVENIAPISSTAGFRGNLIGQALQWNPTRSLYKPGSDSLFIEYGSDNINPLAYSEAYFDNAKVTTVLANVAPSYKFNDHLEFKSQMSLNYSTGLRRQYTTAYININDLAINTTVGSPTFGKGGEASISQNEIVTSQITNTLSYNNDISKSIYLNAVIGQEYIRTNFGGGYQYGRTLLVSDKPYYNYIASSEQGTRRLTNFQDPTTELQSYFGRAIFNIKDKYVVTGTFRADGSSKFGSGNKYGYFPSIALGWNVSKENFMKSMTAVSNLKLRLSYGTTGNQDYPSGVALFSYRLNGNSPASFEPYTNLQPELSWESSTTSNVGLEFGIIKNKINFVIDYFNRTSKNILYAKDAPDPVPAGSSTTWYNIPKTKIINSGLEISMNANVIQNKDFSLGLNVNASFLKNIVKDFDNQIPTGEVNGQGLSGAYAQLLANDKPLNTFYLKRYTGIDKSSGISTYEGGEEKFFMGSANPKTLLGFTINAGYKKFSIEANMNGAFGHYIYNNTANAVLAFNNLGKKNIGKREFDIAVRDGEKTVNPTSASSRYLEKGDYLRMANLSLSYNTGSFGKVIKSSNVYITAQNLFIITKFSGFDPEVNVNKAQNGVPSFGMEYTPYPSAKTINFGFNISL